LDPAEMVVFHLNHLALHPSFIQDHILNSNHFMSLYTQRGVSAQKEEVHKATEKLDKGLFPYAFCKIYSDFLGGDKDWVNLMHSDGAGTKSILAYLYWRETGDISVWKGISKDAIAMNLDDLLCVGIYDNILFSSTIDRNKKIIPGEVLEAIIDGTQEFFDELKTWGTGIQFLGGETADVGDVVRTISVNGTMTARWKKSGLVTNEKIEAGDLILGLASFGQAKYEKEYNSGIGSNGLTSARHDLLHKTYGARFHESYDNSLDEHLTYIGPHKMTDEISLEGISIPQGQSPLTVGKLLLSPTRTYAPLMKALLESHFEDIHGLIHCSGGGQTKCMKYLPGNFGIVKDNLFEPPVIFKMIQKASGSSNREMYQVFNMGHRMEIFTHEKGAAGILELAKQFQIDAQVIGRVEPSDKKKLVIKTGGEEIRYE
jgi:phosphoribosylformylglycinamidine cyclo-ligase